MLALVVLVVTTPGAADVAEELIAHAMGIECCDGGGCCDGAGQSCPGTCPSCSCCAPSRATVTTAPLLPPLERPPVAITGGGSELPRARGFRAAPFRPPTA
jgi:hypothetical protein